MASAPKENKQTPDEPLTRTINGATPGPQIGQAQQYLPATYPTAKGNIREDR